MKQGDINIAESEITAEGAINDEGARTAAGAITPWPTSQQVWEADWSLLAGECKDCSKVSPVHIMGIPAVYSLLWGH